MRSISRRCHRSDKYPTRPQYSINFLYGLMQSFPGIVIQDLPRNDRIEGIIVKGDAVILDDSQVRLELFDV